MGGGGGGWVGGGGGVFGVGGVGGGGEGVGNGLWCGWGFDQEKSFVHEKMLSVHIRIHIYGKRDEGSGKPRALSRRLENMDVLFYKPRTARSMTMRSLTSIRGKAGEMHEE